MADFAEPLLQSTEESLVSDRLSVVLGRATGHRGASLMVRQTAAQRLAERRADWGFSRPVVALDIAWNLAFSVASLGILSATFVETPNVPIRFWIAGYALQCLLHVGLVWAEYRRRSRRRGDGVEERRSAGSDLEGSSGEREQQASDEETGGTDQEFRLAKSCESINTVVSFVWWIVGLFWVVSGGDFLLQKAPTLYWLAVVLLAFDVLFVVFCVALTFVIGVAICFCLPCIITILYNVAGQEGASDADISALPLYKFVQVASIEDEECDLGGMMVHVESHVRENECERSILPEDAVCCICLTVYEDGAELRSLPCSHHFHAACIAKWLSINATCPLCKYDILKGSV